MLGSYLLQLEGRVFDNGLPKESVDLDNGSYFHSSYMTKRGALLLRGRAICCPHKSSRHHTASFERWTTWYYRIAQHCQAGRRPASRL